MLLHEEKFITIDFDDSDNSVEITLSISELGKKISSLLFGRQAFFLDSFVSGLKQQCGKQHSKFEMQASNIAERLSKDAKEFVKKLNEFISLEEDK